MIKTFTNSQFEDFADRDSGAKFENIEFSDCQFSGCDLSRTDKVDLRTTVRNINLRNIEARGCIINAAIIENVLIEGLTAYNSAFRGAVFKHVTFLGSIGQLMIIPTVLPGTATVDVQHMFEVVNKQYYSTVDWALDISKARFKEADIRGIPARLIRRDPETQFVLTRKRALQGNWKNVNLSGTYWATSINFFLEEEEEDRVLVAPKRDRNFKGLLMALKELQKAGALEPD